MKRKVLIVSVIVFLLVIGLGITIQLQQKTDHFEFPRPEEVVKQYFTAWNNKNYPDMYATLSGGFKKIEPTAKTLVDFKQYAEAQGIENIKIINIKEESNDGVSATVSYSVEFEFLGGKKQNFSDKLSLKLRESDIIRGWKLIHPYGQNIDIS